MATYSSRTIGQKYTLDYRLYLEENGKVLSSWHDIPIYHDISARTLNMVVEVPRWSNAKYEISRNEFLNPIKQDVKKEQPRFIHNCFPYKGYPWNYGAIPQTWEDPSTVLESTSTHGDNDPLDVLDISSSLPTATNSGDVKRVKPLGALCVLDEGETDWKIIAIDVRDPLASKLDDIGDVDTHMPGLLNSTKEWFSIYKVPAGKKRNPIAFDGQYKGAKEAIKLIQECNEAWQRLMAGNVDQSGISLANTSVPESKSKVDEHEIAKVPKGQDAAPAAVDGSVHEWAFVARM